MYLCKSIILIKVLVDSYKVMDVTSHQCRAVLYSNAVQACVPMIVRFNEDYTNKDGQDAYLSSMISVHGIERRRSRKDDTMEDDFKSFSYYYILKIRRQDQVVPVQDWCATKLSWQYLD